MNLKKTIQVCLKNGNRLLYDAETLRMFGSYASAYALSKFAQEEFAKALILKFVHSGSLRWTSELRRSLNHHISKQLISIILDYLSPSNDNFLKQVRTGNLMIWPKKVADAMNIYIHEILRRWQSKNWDWVDDPNWDKDAKEIHKGKEENRKHEALYSNISKEGEIISIHHFTKKEVSNEIERASRFAIFIKNENTSMQYQEIAQIIEILDYS